MSNIARLNKNSIISLSTNDNTSSLKVNKRMDEGDLKRIQRRLADKVHTNTTRKANKKYKEKTKVKTWLKSQGMKKAKGLGDSADLKTKLAKSYNRILSPQITSLRSQFNSILDRTRKRKSSGASKKGKVSGLLSYRQNLSKKNSVKTKSAKSENKSLSKKGKKKVKKYKYQGMKLKTKTSKSSKLERKKSLNDKVMTPSIKHNNSDARLQTSKHQSYGLFYSPRDASSKILNISGSYGKNFRKGGKKGNITSNIVQKNNNNAKYLKRMGKKNPLFELRKGMLSKKKSERRTLIAQDSHDLGKHRSVQDIMAKNGQKKYMKKPMFFEKKAAEIDNLLQLISSRESLDKNGDISEDSGYDFEEENGVNLTGRVNPVVLKMAEEFKKTMADVINRYERDICVIGMTKKKRFLT